MPDVFQSPESNQECESPAGQDLPAIDVTASDTRSTPRPLLLDVLALGLLILATLGFFWRVLFAGDWMPAGGGDLVSFLYPYYNFAARALNSGTIPLWNPYLWGGAPFAADIQAGLFYPINVIFFLLAPDSGYRGLMSLAIFHVWLAGAGTYLCLRYWLPGPGGAMSRNGSAAAQWSLSLRPILPPLLGAVAFMFSDFFVVHFGNLNLIAQVAWLPFIFLFFHRSLDTRRPWLAAWAGVLLAVAATAGHVQPLVFVVLVLILDWLYQVIVAWRNRRHAGPDTDDKPFFVSLTVCLLATLTIGVGLAGAALVPAYEMSSYTQRTAYHYGLASQYSLAPAQLVGLLVPGFFGRDPATHWGAWDRVEVGYVGVLTLVLALFVLLARRDRITVFLGLLAGFCLLAAMGGYTILHGWLYQFVPGLGEMRAPARLIFVLDFALAGLAALGLDTLLEDSQQGRSVLKSVLRVGAWVLGAIVLFVVPLSYFAVITNQDKDPVIFARTSAAANGVVFFAGLLAASLVLLYLFQRRYFRPLFVGALAVGLLFVDLASLGSNVDVGHGDPGQAFEHPAIIDFLKSDTSLYRIDSRTDVWHLWQPNTSLIHDIFDVAGLVNPLTLADYDTYLQAVPDRSSALFDFLNAKYVIAAKDVVLDWDKFVPVFDADPALNVYLNRNALPRAWLVHRALVVSDHDAALAAIQAADFDPATQVILEAGQPLSTTAGDSSDISFDVYDLNRIHLQVDTPGDGYLVLSEVWYPGWQVRVDGVSTPLLRANYAFRAVSLSPGQHQVEMVFRPTSWLIGLALSVFTCLCLLVWLGVRLLAKSQTS